VVSTVLWEDFLPGYLNLSLKVLNTVKMCITFITIFGF
jgi:hypothetical protein